jgi:ABC-type uncharacterized transport system YnjBCD ATPase subunit
MSADARSGLRTFGSLFRARLLARPLKTGDAICLSLAGPVVGARRAEPDPISNSAVKRLSADGTVSQDPGE